MKYVSFFLAILFLSSISLSQDLGIKMGVIRSEILLTDQKASPLGGAIDYGLGPAVNPSIGLFANVINSPFIDIQTNLSFIQIGSSKTQSMSYWNWDDDPSSPPKHADYTSVINIQYIQFSFSCQPKFSLGKTIAYLSIEPSVSYLTKISNLLLTDGKIDFVFGAAGGIGVNIATLAEKNIFIEVKYYRDLTSFYKSPYAKFWNTYIMISFGAAL